MHERKSFQYRSNASDVVEVVMTNECVVDLLNTELVEIVNCTLAVSKFHVLAHVEEYDFSLWRNQDSTVCLSGINVMNLEFA
jgi:hypothetical protein